MSFFDFWIPRDDKYCGSTNEVGDDYVDEWIDFKTENIELKAQIKTLQTELDTLKLNIKSGLYACMNQSVQVSEFLHKILLEIEKK